MCVRDLWHSAGREYVLLRKSMRGTVPLFTRHPAQVSVQVFEESLGLSGNVSGSELAEKHGSAAAGYALTCC